MNPTPKATLDEINGLLNSSFAGLLQTLFARWHDEKGCESKQAYLDHLNSAIPEGFTATKFTARPFGFVFQVASFPEATYRFTANARGVSWSRVA